MDEVQSTSQDQGNTCDRIPHQFLVELTSLDELAFPAKSTKRVRYTCVACTSKTLILGTSTGTAYIFSRFAAKSRSRVSSPVPVHVFTTRDGQISTISLSSSGDLMAIGGDSGRVSVAQLNEGQPPTLLYSAPGDARFPDKVAALAWSNDNKHVYSGHASGNLQAHRLGNRSVFRNSHQKLHKFDGEITQMDAYQDNLIVATTMAAFLYNLENGTVQQIGKKPRSTPSPLGACYVRPSDGTGYIVAARPNGRIWESNLVGVVYRTHQFRQTQYVPRAPPVSFRSQYPFPTDASQFEGIHPENQDVTFNVLKILKSDERSYILSAVGARICIVDLDSSKIVVITELENDILDISTFGNDVFVLLSDSKGLRKFSLFERSKAIEKLHLKLLFEQAAQLICFCYPLVEFSKKLVSETAEGLNGLSKKKEMDKLNQQFSKVIEEMEERRIASESHYDNMADEIEKDGKTMSKKLPSGVHRVLRNVQESGYDDDFSFNTPQALRERSRSSPCRGVDANLEPVDVLTSPTNISKRASEPSNLESKKEWRKNGTPDVVEEDILHRARAILDSDGQVVEKESLRTLLQLEGIKRDEIRFTPTVTIGNAAKALAEMALAAPVDLSNIWKESLKKEKEKLEASEAKRDTNERNEIVVMRKQKANIVKVVRPGVKLTPRKNFHVKVDQAKNDTPSKDDFVEKVDPVTEEMRRKQDELWLDLRLSHIRQETTKERESDSEKEDVKKSDTDYTLTTERGDSATPTNEIWQNPLSDISQISEQLSDFGLEDSCKDCGMHRSWAVFAMLMTVCTRPEVVKSSFETGGVPSSRQNWEAILKHVALQNENSEDIDVSALCPRCETALSNVEKNLADGWKSIELVEAGANINIMRIHDRCLNTPNEKMRTIIERKADEKCDVEKSTAMPDESESEKNVAEDIVHNESIEINIAKEVEPPPKFLEEKKFWKWTRGVKLKTLLALAFFCEGKKQVLEMISADEKFVAKRMKPDDWSTLAVMTSRESYFKNTLSAKTISTVLESVSAEEWAKPKKQLVRRSSSLTGSMNSWIVDSNGKCPLCSLSIKMVVGGKDRGIVSFPCGHGYHKMCLAGKLLSSCIVCRSRARKSAIPRQSSTPTKP